MLLASPALAQAAGTSGASKILLITIGSVIFLASVVGAYAAHYFLDVKRTNSAGTIQVKSFGDYLKHNALNAFVTIGLSITSLIGIGLLVFGLII